jgi:hypothetical protein
MKKKACIVDIKKFRKKILKTAIYRLSLCTKIQNAIKLENICNLITSPSSYQCMHKKTTLQG